MPKFAEIFQNLVVKNLNEVYLFFVQFGPKIALALLILLIGWVCAVLLKKIIAKLLKALGFDVVSQKVGFERFLEKGGVQTSPSLLIGKVFYWLIIFSALVMAFNALELEAASKLLTQVATYIPRIVVALILLTLGIFLSRFVGKFVQTTAHLANIPFYAVLGRVAGYVVVGLAIIMAMEYLGATDLIAMELFIVIFGIVPLVAFLIFLIGGRDIVANMLARNFLLKEYKTGEKIEFDSVSAEVIYIGLLLTRLKDSKGEILVPNSELIKKTVKKIK